MSNEKLEEFKKNLALSIPDATAAKTVIATFELMYFKLKELESAVDTLKAISDDRADLQKANDHLIQTIKNIHIALNAHRDQLPETLLGLIDTLSTFIVSPAAIKSGVRANAHIAD